MKEGALRQHIKWCLERCRQDGKALWMHQAFGAVQFYGTVCQDSEEHARIEKMWNSHYKIEFEEILYGQSLSVF